MVRNRPQPSGAKSERIIALVLKKEDQMKSEDQNDWIGPAPEVDAVLPGPLAEQLIRRDEAITSPSKLQDPPWS